MDLKIRLASSWDRMYEYARVYYEHRGVLEVPVSFKTNNGQEHNEDGQINLGSWLNTQKHFYQKKKCQKNVLLYQMVLE